MLAASAIAREDETRIMTWLRVVVLTHHNGNEDANDSYSHIGRRLSRLFAVWKERKKTTRYLISVHLIRHERCDSCSHPHGAWEGSGNLRCMWGIWWSCWGAQSCFLEISFFFSCHLHLWRAVIKSASYHGTMLAAFSQRFSLLSLIDRCIEKKMWII